MRRAAPVSAAAPVVSVGVGCTSPRPARVNPVGVRVTVAVAVAELTESCPPTGMRRHSVSLTSTRAAVSSRAGGSEASVVRASAVRRVSALAAPSFGGVVAGVVVRQL